MSNLVYHSVESETNKEIYQSFDNIDFLINVGDGRSLVKNSVRLVGNLKVNSTGTTRVPDDEFIFVNRNCGAHAVISSINTNFTSGANGGLVENIQHYNRMVNMTAIASLGFNDMLNGKNQCELRAPNDSVANQYGHGQKTINGGATASHDDINFSIQPEICLNKMEGGDLDYNKSGAIRLSFNLEQNHIALKGIDEVLNSNYSLHNLRLTYYSVPTTQNPTVEMRLVYNVKGSILSSFCNISAKVPAICDAVSCVFQQQRKENVIVEDGLECDNIKGLREVQFLFNDSTNEYISYVLDDLGEMSERFVDSLVNTGHNQVNANVFSKNNGFGLGLPFNGFVDLSNQKFNLQINSGVDATAPMNAYLYFHSKINV